MWELLKIVAWQIAVEIGYISVVMKNLRPGLRYIALMSSKENTRPCLIDQLFRNWWSGMEYKCNNSAASALQIRQNAQYGCRALTGTNEGAANLGCIYVI